MPKDFEKCVRGGGRVRTVSGPSKRHSLTEDEFTRVCFDATGMHRGETHVKKGKQELAKKGKK